MLYDQHDFRNRLYQELPPEWFPDLEASPNLAAVLDMISGTWSSKMVVERTVQFDTSTITILIDRTDNILAGSIVTGIGVVGNPVVVRIVDGTTLRVSVVQNLLADTRLTFALPDAKNDGLKEFLDYSTAQSRLQTSTGFWLDLFGRDFFGGDLQRHHFESDDNFRRRLLINLLAPRVSRCAVTCNVQNLTGFKPRIIEPRNNNDCGGYASLQNKVWNGAAYGFAGAYGSMELPFQFFIACTRPNGEGIPLVNGYSMASAGYATYPQPWGFVGPSFPSDTGTGEYVQLADIDNNNAVTDDDIYRTVADSVAAGVTAWTSIESDIQSEIRSGGLLNINFYLNLTTLTDSFAGPPGEIRATGAFGLSASALITTSRVDVIGTISLSATAALANPNPIVAASSIRLAAAGALNTILATGSATPFSLMAVSTATSNVNSVGIGVIPIAAAVVMTRIDTFVATGKISLKALATVGFIPGASIGSFVAHGIALNGPLSVQFISVNFILGTSTLIPAGGRLGRTLVLGQTLLGNDYGY